MPENAINFVEEEFLLVEGNALSATKAKEVFEEMFEGRRLRKDPKIVVNLGGIVENDDIFQVECLTIFHPFRTEMQHK